MEPKSVEKLSKSDEIEPRNGQDEASVSSGDRQVENHIEPNKDTLEDIGSNLTASDMEVWKAYLASKQQWEEVYRRLADS
jgi:hypothetical protein